MRNGFRVFDADAHVLEPQNLWDRFLDARFQGRVGWRQPIPGIDKFRPVLIDGVYARGDKTLYGNHESSIKYLPEQWFEKYGDTARLGFPGHLVAEAMAQDGVDLSVVYGPGFELWMDGIDPELQAGLARAYNRWGEEMRATSGGRVIVAAPVPVGDMRRAVEEVQYAYDHLGARCFWAPPYEFSGRNLGHRYYDPLFDLLQDLDCAFATHSFMGRRGPSAGDSRFWTYTEEHVVVHPHEAQMGMLSMIVSGVFERFPRLRCAYLEAGSGWLPSWLHRIDEHLELTTGKEATDLSMSATEYFLRNCWITTEAEEPYVRHVIDALGDDRIIFETDFPHPEAKFPYATLEFLELDPDRISMDSKRKILWDNAVDFYRFPDSHMPTEFIEATAVPVRDLEEAR